MKAIDDLTSNTFKSRRIEYLCKKPGDLDLIKKFPREEYMPIADVHHLFGNLVNSHPSIQYCLDRQAPFVENSKFESVVAIIQNGRIARLSLIKKNQSRQAYSFTSSNIKEDGYFSVAERFKKRCHVSETDGHVFCVDLSFIASTSSVYERLFLIVDFFNRYYAIIIFAPVRFESQTFLCFNGHLRDASETNDIITKNRSLDYPAIQTQMIFIS